MTSPDQHTDQPPDPPIGTPLVSFHGGHTVFDGDGAPEQFVEAAIAKGFLALGFSEHMPPPPRYNYPFYPDPSTSRQQFDQYAKTITQLQTAYRSDLHILFGVETEYLPDEESYLSDFLGDFSFDYVVGSVHFVAGIGFDTSQQAYDRAVSACGGLEAMAVEYYRCVRGLLAMGVADVLGHLDLIDIFAPESISAPQVTEAEDETLAAARQANVILDVNARGLLKPVKRVYPRADLLARAQALGVPATFGDDSHAPDQVGARLEHCLRSMRTAGYDTVETLLRENQQVVRKTFPLSSTLAPRPARP